MAGFSTGFNRGLVSAATVIGIRNRAQDRAYEQKVRTAEEGARRLRAIQQSEGTDDMSKWSDQGLQDMGMALGMGDEEATSSILGERPGGKSTLTGIHRTPNGVAATVKVRAEDGSETEAPITVHGTSEDSDPIVEMRSANDLIKGLEAKRRSFMIEARATSPAVDKWADSEYNKEKTNESLEVLNDSFNGQAKAPTSLQDAAPTNTLPAPDQPAPVAAAAPAPQGGEASGLASAATEAATDVTAPPPNQPAVTSVPGGYTGATKFTPEMDESIGSFAAERGLDPNLIKAIIDAESSGNPNAFNGKADATGLMQLTPIGLKEFNIQYGKNYTMADMKDPAKNMEAGTGLLKYYIDKQGGDVAKGLAAYNGGPTRLNEHGGDISKMPEETRDYVAKITGNWTASSAEGEVPSAEAAAPSAEAEAPVLSPEDEFAAAQAPAPTSASDSRKGRRMKAHETNNPVAKIDAEIEKLQGRAAKMEGRAAGRARGGGNKVGARERIEKQIADLEVEKVRALRDPAAERAEREQAATVAQQQEDAEINSQISALVAEKNPQAAEEALAASGSTPATEEEVGAMAQTVAETPVAKKMNLEQRNAMYHLMHAGVLEPSQVVNALQTGRLNKQEWQNFTNAAGQLVRYDAAGNMQVLPETAAAMESRQLKAMKAREEVSASRQDRLNAMQDRELKTSDAELSFLKEQTANIHGGDETKWAQLRDQMNTTDANWGLSTNRAGITTANKAHRLGQDWKASKEFALLSPTTWFEDEPILTDLSPGILTMKAPNNPFNIDDPDPEVRAQAVEHTMKTHVEPYTAAGLNPAGAMNAGLVSVEGIRRGYFKDAAAAQAAIVGAVAKDPRLAEQPGVMLKRLEDYFAAQ